MVLSCQLGLYHNKASKVCTVILQAAIQHIRFCFHETASVVRNDTSAQTPNCASTENTDDFVHFLT